MPELPWNLVLRWLFSLHTFLGDLDKPPAFKFHLCPDGSQIYGLSWWLRWLRICLQCKRPRFNPWLGKIPWRRDPPQYSCLENFMDRGAWQATVHGVTKSWTDLLQPGPLTWSPVLLHLPSEVLTGIANFTNPKPGPAPKSPLKLAHPGVLLIWLIAAPFFQCPGPDLAVIFHTFPPLTPHVHATSESCWTHHQRCPTISHHLHCHHPGPHYKHLPPGYGIGLPAGSSASALAPHPTPICSPKQPEQSNVGPHFTKTYCLIMTSHNSSTIGLPISSLTSFPAAFSQSSSDPPSQSPNLPSDNQAHSSLHICCVSEWNVCRAPFLTSFRSLLISQHWDLPWPHLLKISTSLSPQVLLAPLSYLMFFFVLITVKHATIFTYLPYYLPPH